MVAYTIANNKPQIHPQIPDLFLFLTMLFFGICWFTEEDVSEFELKDDE